MQAGEGQKDKEQTREAREQGMTGTRTQLEGHEFTEVGWEQGAETGGGPQSWRGAQRERSLEGDTAGSAA